MKRAIKRYAGIFRGVSIPWLLLLAVAGISIVQSTLSVRTATLTASIIDSSQNAIKVDELVRYALYVLILGVTSMAYTYINGLSCEKIRLGVRKRLWKKLMVLPMSSYDQENGNEFVSRVTADVDATSYYFELGIALINSLYGNYVAYKSLFALNKRLAAWALLVIPLTFGVCALFSWVKFRAGAAGQNSLAGAMGYLAEHVRNFRLIRAFGMEEQEAQQGNAHFSRQFWAEMYENLAAGIQSAGSAVISCGIVILAFVFGGKMVGAGEMTTGQLISFYTLSTMVNMYAVLLYSCIARIAEQNGKLQKVSQLLEEAEESTDGMEMDIEDGDLVLENITFSYGEKQVLHGLNARIPVGQVTAIVGPNGSGKSTLLKLLERIYAPDEGRILFGKRDCREFSLHSWRRTVAIVAQDCPIMAGTVRENILYGLEQPVSEQELIAAAKQANAYGFIVETPGQFDAETGPGGQNFSGGQRQCMAIARAILRNPDYLLLDEATSNLDAKSARTVTAALENLMRGRTTVMVAHSSTAIRAASHIIVMREGTIEAAGTPEEVYDKSQYYRNFVRETAAQEKERV